MKEHRVNVEELKQAMTGDFERLVTKVRLGSPDKAFCFVQTPDGESFFCLKKQLPPVVTDGGTVTFDAVPSFDKKKNRETWRVKGIRQS